MDDEITRAARARKGTPFLSTDQAAFYLGLSARKLQQMRKDGVGPAFRQHSRYVRYHIDDLDSWSRALLRQQRLARLPKLLNGHAEESDRNADVSNIQQGVGD